MKQKEFYDANQASAYLTHSVIRVDEKPVYIQKVIRDRKRDGEIGYLLYYYGLGSVGDRAKLFSIWADTPSIDMNPVPLGMLAPGKESAAATYCSRIPRRAWKIGLTQQALALTHIDKAPEKRIRFNPSDVLISTSLENTIIGDYPSVKKAKELSVDRSLPVAFSRAFAVWNNDLYYKDIGVPVGQVGTKTHLFDEFAWLREKLDEDLNG